MKASQFTDAHKAFIIKQGEGGTPAAEVCRKAGISRRPTSTARRRIPAMMPSEMERLRELEHENARLKKILAALSLDKEMLQDVIKREIFGLVGRERWST